MDRNIFKNLIWEEELRQKGYVVIQLLDLQQVDELYDFFQSTRPDIRQGFHSTSTNNNLTYRKEVHNFIEKIFQPIVDEILINYESIYASFVVKEPGKEGNFPFHMDWSMVDEKKFISLAFWTPLVDTYDDNGSLLILERSHKAGMSYRGGPFLFQSMEDNDWKIAPFPQRQLCLKRGEVVIYDHRLFHGSLPNKTNMTRPALNFTVKPKEAQLIHYHQNGSKIEKYEIDKSFFQNYIMGENPDQALLCDTIDAGSMLFLNDQLIYQIVQ